MKYRIYKNKSGKFKIKQSYLGFMWFDLQDEIKIETYGSKTFGSYQHPLANTMKTVLFDTLDEAKERVVWEKNNNEKTVDDAKWTYVGEY